MEQTASEASEAFTAATIYFSTVIASIKHIDDNVGKLDTGPAMWQGGKEQRFLPQRIEPICLDHRFKKKVNIWNMIR